MSDTTKYEIGETLIAFKANTFDLMFRGKLVGYASRHKFIEGCCEHPEFEIEAVFTPMEKNHGGYKTKKGTWVFEDGEYDYMNLVEYNNSILNLQNI